ncbi:MAG: hypothetical protein HYV04_14570 [Deltaproteobacteria bacterium]|nr:hypothetical protein [Deltaproteobacteria bacterium]
MRPVRPEREAASVILLRQVEDGGFEVCLGRPAPGEEPACGPYTFPRRAVTKEDVAEITMRRSRGVSQSEAREILGAELRPSVALAHWIAGVRALFEELGVVLCVTETGNPPLWEKRRANLLARREGIVRGEISFRSSLETEGLVCDLRQLRYFSHWLESVDVSTPAQVRYFLARLPANQERLEAVRSFADCCWITADRALARHERRELPLTFAAFATIRTLADFDSWQSLCAAYGFDLSETPKKRLE